jgi:putative phage-type endonuclease
MEQRTDEWFQARLGKVTASRISDVLAKTKTGYSISRQNYLVQLVTERLTGQKADSFFMNQAMQDGVDREPIARKLYEVLNDVIVTEVGFYDHPRIAMSGASPDGLLPELLVFGIGLVEIKCPIETTHTNTLMSKKVPSKYIPQIQWQMACVPNAKFCDFISYNPNFPPEMQLFVSRVEKDLQYILELETEVEQFLKEVDQAILQLKE